MKGCEVKKKGYCLFHLFRIRPKSSGVSGKLCHTIYPYPIGLCRIMPEQFNTQHPPFDKLDSEQTKVLLDSLDIAYFRQGDAILDIGEQSDSLFVLIKGAVEQRTSDRVIAHFGHDDLFDADALFSGKARHQFIAIEDVLCYLVPKPVFLSLCENNQEFEHYFNGNLSQRKQLLRSAQKQQNLAEFILSRVNSDIYHPPLILESATSLQNTTAKMNELDIDAAW